MISLRKEYSTFSLRKAALIKTDYCNLRPVYYHGSNMPNSLPSDKSINAVIWGLSMGEVLIEIKGTKNEDEFNIYIIKYYKERD